MRKLLTRLQLFRTTKTSTLTEITDSVKKESKTLVFGFFLYVFKAFSKVKIYR